MKTCFRCGQTKPLTEFYEHPRMADGRLNKCKECARRDVRARRSETIEARREYDRRRFQEQPQRRDRRLLEPEKVHARRAVTEALKRGTLTRQPCEGCGSTERVQGHHDDYAKQLDVRWLCTRCHGIEHRRTG